MPIATDDTPKTASYITDSNNKYVNEFKSNVKSNVIEITEDKLENILLKYLNMLNIRQSWITPLSLFITIILVIITATFNTKLGIDKSVWEAIFYLGAFGTFVWTVISGIKAFSASKEVTISSLLDRIKDDKN